MEPARIGRYEVHSPLGRGGMGTVYRARDPAMDRWVAVKTITVQDARQRARFQQEVRAAGALNHPHITTVYDVGEEGDLAYIIMELVEGDTLSNRLSSPIPWPEAVKLLFPICQALAYAHSRGVIHRDVKPANILISTEGQVKLTDFGVARLEAALRRITESGSTVGTPLYTAPEQIRNENVDGRADLFSVGVVLFETVTGQHPFVGETLAQVVYRITRPEPVNLAPLASLAPSTLINLIARALRKDAVDRFFNADEMAAALTLCLEQLEAISSPDLIPSSWPSPATPSTHPIIDLVASNLSLSPDEEALLRSAFAGHDRLYLEREFSSGYSKARVLLVTPVRSGGQRLTQIVLKLDTPAAIDQEWQAYQEYVKDTLPPVTARILEEPLYATDGQLALLCYTFAGGLGNAPPDSLRAYYARHTGEEVGVLLEKGVFRAFGPKWWLQRRTTDLILRREYDRLLPVHLILERRDFSEVTVTPHNLVAEKTTAHTCSRFKQGQFVQIQGFTVEEVQAKEDELILQALPPSGSRTNPIRIRVTNLSPGQMNYQVGQVAPSLTGMVMMTRNDLLRRLAEPVFPGQDLDQKQITIGGQLYPNPLYDYESLLNQRVSAMTSIIHGDLNLENILVTPASDLAWLIDFATTREGHNLYDFIRLEAQVITKLLSQSRAGPEAVAHMMSVLHQSEPSSPQIPADLQKPFAVLVAIRQIVKVCLYSRNNWDEYYLGLVITLLGTLKFKDLDTSTRGLALAAAATVRGLISIPALQLTPLPVPTAVSSPSRPWPKVIAIGVAILTVLMGLAFWVIIPPSPNTPTSTPVVTNIVIDTPPPPPPDTPTPSPFPSPTPTACVADGKAIGILDVRSEPEVDYQPFGKVSAGTSIRVTGGISDSQWWQIADPRGPNGFGWVEAEFVELSGTCRPPVISLSQPLNITPTLATTTTLTPTPEPSKISAPTIFPPANYQVFFAANLDGEYRIYKINLGDNSPTQLTNGPGDEGRPALSPDGQSLAFASNRNGNVDIFILNLNTQEIRQLTSDPGHDHTPAWSPDGQRIAFQAKRAGNYDIYVMNADGSNQIALTDHSANDYWPTWSPDGTKILFESERDGDGRSQLYLMSADGSNKNRLIASSGNDGMPAWSPTGQIAFYSDRDGNRELYVMDSLTSPPRRLTTNSTNDWFPAWSPDGRYLAYTSGEYMQGQIYILDTTDQSIFELPQFGIDNSDPAMAFAIDPSQSSNVVIEDSASVEDFESYDTASLRETYILNDAWDKNELAIDVTTLTDAADKGQVLAITYNIKTAMPDNYVGLGRNLSVNQDWSNFRAVRFWIRNEAAESDFVFQWGEASTREGEVWKTSFTLEAGKNGLIEIPLTSQFFSWADWSSDENGQMDLDQVSYYAFFVAQVPPNGGTIYLDSIELLPATTTPSVQPPAPSNHPDTGFRPAAVFMPLWDNLDRGDGLLGYPLGSAVTDHNYARQPFERGFMFWWGGPQDPQPIWIIHTPDPVANHGETWARYDNQWYTGQPEYPPACPQTSPPLGPKFGFGMTWCYQAGVKEQVGRPLKAELGSGDTFPKGAVQFFQGGVMFENPTDRQVWALIDGGGWYRLNY